MSDRGRILVVEDERIQRRILQVQLESMGYEAASVASGEEALELLTRRRFDAVLMDCQMPGLDGYETTRLLRRSEAAGEHTVVIAITATHSAEVARLCEAAGMDAVTVKPVRRLRLETLLDMWLAPRAAEDRASGAADADSGMKRSFLEESLRQIRTMHEALRSEDLRSLAATAHAMAGNSCVLDVLPLAKDCRELEALALNGDLTSCKCRVPRLERTLQHASHSLPSSA